MGLTWWTGMMAWKPVEGCCKQVMVLRECLIGRWSHHYIPTGRKPLNQNHRVTSQKTGIRNGNNLFV